MREFRSRVAFYLEDVTTSIGLTVNLVILGLILVSLGIYVAQTYPLPETLQFWFRQLDLGILTLFTLEYCIRFWCAESKIKFIFNIFSIIDLLSILPLFFGIFDIRYFRIFRWFRILRIIRFFGSRGSIFQVKTADQLVFTRILLTLFSIIFVYAGLIYQIEHPVNPEVYRTFFDAFYFAVVTMTTVGFGDVIPLSDGGKFVTVLMILTGVVLIPLQISDLTKQLLRSNSRIENPCPKCGLSSHDTDANFCKNCGTKLT
ncbi:ion transporter [Pannus brasiliensis CCIBt3594]|uniref:Ion transporter n=1 Tax=Pannus brasiliensis CCIBt3594 TaxID=1427578 RepID=A0AAW9QUK7_9CHRO